MTPRAVAIGFVPCIVAACAGVLGVRESPERSFEHRAHVNRGIACTKCHAEVAGADEDSPIDLPGTASCTSCHEKPHDPRACHTCHGREDHRRALAEAKAHLRFSHASHAGPAQGECMRCHAGVLAGDGPLRPTMATCLGCHEHREQWAERRCLPCHRNLEDEHVRPQSHMVHGVGFAQRHGVAAGGSRELCSTCHTESECAACHGINVPALPQILHFDQPQVADMHARGFASRHAIEARLDPPTCVSCHRDESFCRDCHARSGLLAATPQRASPHPSGWVGTAQNLHGAEARRDPASCASCHGGAGEQLCVGCHRVGGPGGNPHPPGFSSRKPASELPCRLCHAEMP